MILDRSLLDDPASAQALLDHMGLVLLGPHGSPDPALLASLLPSPSEDVFDHLWFSVVVETVRIRHTVGFHSWIEERQVRRVSYI